MYSLERNLSVRGSSKFSNIPKEADRVIEFGEQGDSITIQVYEDHLRVIPGGLDDE